MNYANLTEIKNYIVKEVTPGFESQITLWISGVSRYIDKTCNRNIARDTSTIIKYDGDGSDVLLIKDCCAITLIELDDVDITASVLKYPTTKDYASRLVLRDSYWTPGLQNVEVTGKHGMGVTPPDDIRLATTILVGAICRNQILGEKAGTTEKIGSYSISYSTPEQKAEIEMAKGIINSYKRIAI